VTTKAVRNFDIILSYYTKYDDNMWKLWIPLNNNTAEPIRLAWIKFLHYRWVDIRNQRIIHKGEKTTKPMIVARTVCHRIRQMDGLSIADRHYHGIHVLQGNVSALTESV
jgi:hypothetical protein